MTSNNTASFSLRSRWFSMFQRCENPNSPDYKNYGGRGIKVCKRWHSFKNFFADMGEPPDGKSLDRWPDNGGNYEPGNVRWATRKEQNNNKRRLPVVKTGPFTHLLIEDMPTDLQARAKAAAAMAGITLKAWVKEAIREKLATKKVRNGKTKKQVALLKATS